MIYDRPYMRAKPVHTEVNVLKWLIIANFGIYILQVIVGYAFHLGWMHTNLGLSLAGLSQFKVWTLMSYAFLHDIQSPFHILFNMLALFLFGRETQDRLGSIRFLQVYLLAVMLGGTVWLLLKFAHQNFSMASSAPLIGASAGIAGIISIWCFKHWHDQIQFSLFFLMMPFYISGKVFFYGLLIYESACFLVFELFTGNGLWNVANSAHLGGMAAGWLFNKYILNADPIFNRPMRSRERDKVTASTTSRPSWMPAQESAKPMPLRYKVNVTDRSALRAEVDRILDKISEKGFGSLTSEEKETLNKAKDTLGR